MPRSLQPDRWLFITTLALCLIGAVMVFSSSAVTAKEEFGSAYAFIGKQLVWLIVGLVGMLWLMNTDYRHLRQPAVIFSSLCVIVILLIGVFFLDKSHATHRWIRFGPIGIQPSELAKLVTILYLAWFLESRTSSRRAEVTPDVNDIFHSLAPALGPVMAMIALTLLQPDLGTAFDIFLISMGMLFVAGLSLKYVAYAIAAAVPAVFLLIVRVPYRMNRLLAFLHPDADPQGAGFQMLQSLIAVGSGGFSGVGLMESRQKLFYLPEAHTDFIYAVLCEELGFIGGAIVVLLFGIFAWRGIRAAMAAPDDFGKFLAVGVTVMVVGQALINLSVVLGMMPTKGIPLPFISYGGSSLLVMLLATGVLLNISQHAD
ncbi:MAG: putative lipid II flippase FtsW [Acidobacteria bacterium]|nr:putative lipid II flippase FtsW [Acidobacteriota bacterium]